MRKLPSGSTGMDFGSGTCWVSLGIIRGSAALAGWCLCAGAGATGIARVGDPTTNLAAGKRYSLAKQDSGRPWRLAYPEQRLANGNCAQNVRIGRVRRQSLPQGGVLRPLIGAGTEQQAGTPGGKLVEVVRV